METMEQTRNKEEICMNAVPFVRRFSAGLTDFLFTLFTGFIFVFFAVFIAGNSKSYTALFEQRDAIAIASKLYVKDENGKTQRISTIYEYNSNLTYNEKSELLDENLNYFFNLNTFFSNNDGVEIYNKAKLEAKSDSGENLFNTSYVRVLLNADYDKDYYKFYCDTVDNIAISYLIKNNEYHQLANTIIVVDTTIIASCFLLSFLVFFLVLPLCLRRGHQTLGQKMFKMGLVDVNGLNVKWTKFVGRFFFFLLFEVLLSLVSFFIPFIVSFSFLVFSKRRQMLHDYVFNTYMVDVSQDTIYLNYGEYKLVQKRKEKVMLENENFDINWAPELIVF